MKICQKLNENFPPIFENVFASHKAHLPEQSSQLWILTFKEEKMLEDHTPETSLAVCRKNYGIQDTISLFLKQSCKYLNPV